MNLICFIFGHQKVDHSDSIIHSIECHRCGKLFVHIYWKDLFRNYWKVSIKTKEKLAKEIEESK